MSDSNKARFGMACKFWKDTMLESKNQKRALAKRKRRTARSERRTGKVSKKGYVARLYGGGKPHPRPGLDE